MIDLRPLRRLALGSVAALAILPFTAGAATASGHDDLCDLQDQAPGSFDPILDVIAPVIEAACEDGDEGDDEGGDEGDDGFTLDDLLGQLDLDELEDLLGQLPTEELCALRDEAPEEFAPLLDALEVLTDLVCDADEGGDPEPEPETEEPVEEDEGDGTDEQVASTTPTLPNTGGGAALAGLALLGAAGAVRRLVSVRS
jgi:hypothetical protein